MKRFHVHVRVTDITTNIAFYNRLFGTQPTRQEPDYAKWMLEDTRLNFAISTRGEGVGVDHLGFQTDDSAELAELRKQVETADMVIRDQGEASCCYARSEKHWVTDPQGVAWEHFHSLGDIPVYGQGKRTQGGACCAIEATPSTPAQPVERKAACC